MYFVAINMCVCLAAVLPSTALMLGIPAKVAGCSQIVIATPPRPDGSIVPEVVYVAHLVGASCIVKAGGAQAVAAMAYGTKSVPKVDKICGPGNQYVTAAKMIAQVCLVKCRPENNGLCSLIVARCWLSTCLLVPLSSW